MKRNVTIVVIGLICGCLLSGCQEERISEPNPIDRSQVNQAILGSYSDLAIQNAIITQSTLYPYHFVNNSAQLNTLGRRDLGVLIQHFTVNPGKLSIQQGNVSNELYQERRQIIYEALINSGIPDYNITISKDMPGGSGMSSNEVIEILAGPKGAVDTGDVMSIRVEK